MRVSIKGPCYVLDAEAKTENEKKFLKVLEGSFPTYGRACVSFNEKKADMPYNDSYRRYKELVLIRSKANRYGIELDDSFTSFLKKQEKIYEEIREKCLQEYEAEGKPKEMCGSCWSCEPVIDGDLMCMKYGDYLDIKVGEYWDASTNEHFMFHSYGVKLPKCIVERRVEEEMNKGERAYV